MHCRSRCMYCRSRCMHCRGPAAAWPMAAAPGSRDSRRDHTWRAQGPSPGPALPAAAPETRRPARPPAGRHPWPPGRAGWEGGRGERLQGGGLALGSNGWSGGRWCERDGRVWQRTVRRRCRAYGWKGCGADVSRMHRVEGFGCHARPRCSCSRGPVRSWADPCPRRSSSGGTGPQQGASPCRHLLALWSARATGPARRFRPYGPARRAAVTRPPVQLQAGPALPAAPPFAAPDHAFISARHSASSRQEERKSKSGMCSTWGGARQGGAKGKREGGAAGGERAPAARLRGCDCWAPHDSGQPLRAKLRPRIMLPVAALLRRPGHAKQREAARRAGGRAHTIRAAGPLGAPKASHRRHGEQ